MKKIIKLFFWSYHLVTFNTSRHCRFIPTCSEYAQTAIDKHGFVKGSAFALKRILVCHPFTNRPIYDPV